MKDLQEYIYKVDFNNKAEMAELTHALQSFIFEQSAPAWFEKELSRECFEKRILNSEYDHFVCKKENKIVGFIAIKNRANIFHLFVDANYQNQGIAQKLWQYIKAYFKLQKPHE